MQVRGDDCDDTLQLSHHVQPITHDIQLQNISLPENIYHML